MFDWFVLNLMFCLFKGLINDSPIYKSSLKYWLVVPLSLSLKIFRFFNLLSGKHDLFFHFLLKLIVFCSYKSLKMST